MSMSPDEVAQEQESAIRSPIVGSGLWPVPVESSTDSGRRSGQIEGVLEPEDHTNPDARSPPSAWHGLLHLLC